MTAPYPESPPLADADRTTKRKALAAASVGEFVEYYDFAIYGYLALSISANFFPSGNPTAALLSAFAVYGVAFVVRPLGGLFFGSIGDRYGRRPALTATLLLIGVSTTALGLLPTYAAIGVAAPILLLLCRLMQGFSAGGEAVGASSLALEHAPPDRRGVWNCIVIACSALPSAVAAVLVLGLSSLASEEFFDSYLWRVPFLLALPISLLALVIRLRAEESPAFVAVAQKGQVSEHPIRDTLSQHGVKMVFVFFICSLSALGFYMLIGYFVTYMQVVAGHERHIALLSNCVALLVFAGALVAAGRLSDAVGRKPLLLYGAIAVALAGVPAFMLVGNGSVVGALLGQCLLAVVLAAYGGGSYMLFVEIFPTATRYTGAAISFNLSFALFGGTAPLISTALVDATGKSVAPGFYLVAVAVVAAIVAVFVPETGRRGLDGPELETASG